MGRDRVLAAARPSNAGNCSLSSVNFMNQITNKLIHTVFTELRDVADTYLP